MTKVIDCDGHLIEGAAFAGDLLEKFPDDVKFGEDKNGSWRLMIEDKPFPRSYGKAPGVDIEHALVDGEDIDPSTVEGMLKDCDREGIDIMVAFPSLGLACPGFTSHKLQVDFAHEFNELAGNWSRESKGRIKVVAATPIEDIKGAIKEMEHAKELGLVAMHLPPALQDRNLDNSDLDPFYEAAASMDMALGVHGAPGVGMPQIGVDRLDNYIQVHALSFPFDQMYAMNSMISGGVFERHPKLKVGFMEAGVGWVPYFIDRLHEHYEKRADWIPNGWGREPIESLQRGQIFVSFEAEDITVPSTIELMGADWQMYASDYPHWDSDFPNCTRTVQGRKDIPEDSKKKLMNTNAAKFFGIDGS